ncbi:MAG: hypothetical protein ABF391_02630 [Akkermansiaceae bacterium]
MKHLFVFLFLLSDIEGEILYDTDFDNFPTGANNWAENEGWVSNDTTSGAQAIEANVLPALLNVATLGFERPASDLTFVALNLGYDHVASGEPVVEIDTLLGIEDSTNNRRDDFYLSIYNSAGDRLASIRFDNQDPGAFNSRFGIWREDGTNQFDTLFDFIPGELFNLVATINLENNTWSADIDAIPIFENARFSNTGEPVNFGFLAFEWDLTALTTFGYGDNFLLVADVIVQTVVETPGLQVTHQFSPSAEITLTWETAAGWTDQVQYSEDLVTWFNNLPDSTFDSNNSPGTATFTRERNPAESLRFYRVRRTQSL